MLRYACLFVWVILFAGCAGLKPSSFEKASSTGSPQSFFLGKTESTGVVENRLGRPTQRITTHTEGRLKDGVIFIEQDLNTENGRQHHRSWQIRTIDAHHIDAQSNDIAGTAHGVLYGNYFHWTFTFKLKPGNPLKNVRMAQYMYFGQDGKTLIIRSIIRKAGIKVAQLTEQFRKI